MNFSDSERMISFLEDHGMKPSQKIDQTDLVVFNTCGVRQTAEDRVYGQVHNLRKNNPKAFIVVTGCLAHRKDVQRKLKDKANLFLPINDFFKIENSKLFQNSKFKIQNSLEEKLCYPNYLKITPLYERKNSVFLPIMTGCNNFCSYCVVPYARGREWSRPIEDIVEEVDALSKNGCKEITLLGQNVNSYVYTSSSNSLLSFPRRRESRNLITNYPSGSPIKSGMTRMQSNHLINQRFDNEKLTFPLLLDHLAQSYPHITFKFLTSHPKDFSDELIDVIAKDKNISREIHLPVQSGSNKILKVMNRPYTQAHYLGLIAKTKKKIPDARFSTDVIVGFPGETEKDFQQTLKVFEKVKFFEAYINKYSPRPGTAAFKLENNVSWEEKKRREKIIRKYV